MAEMACDNSSWDVYGMGDGEIVWRLGFEGPEDRIRLTFILRGLRTYTRLHGQHHDTANMKGVIYMFVMKHGAEKWKETKTAFIQQPFGYKRRKASAFVTTPFVPA